MTSKWNADDIEKISLALAEKVSGSVENKALSGEEISNLTPFQQINYFALRNIYNLWEIETSSFKSDYFDFSNPEVQKSFANFKNVLSKHILVPSHLIRNVINQATTDTLSLYLDPLAYFKNDFKFFANRAIPQEWLKKNGVFFRDYNWILQILQTEWDTDIPFEDAMNFISTALGENTEDREADIDAIALEAGLTLPSSEVEELKEIIRTESEEENVSFFENLINKSKPESSGPASFEKILSKFSQNKSGEIKKETVEIEEKVIEAVEIGTIPDRTPEKPKTSYKDLNTPTLNDKMSVQVQGTLADIHQKSKIVSLKGSLSLNERYAFLNVLFKGNAEKFESALNDIENAGSLFNAEEIISKKFVSRYAWNTESEEFKDFMILVKRRFANS